MLFPFHKGTGLEKTVSLLLGCYCTPLSVEEGKLEDSEGYLPSSCSLLLSDGNGVYSGTILLLTATFLHVDATPRGRTDRLDLPSTSPGMGM